MPACVQRLAKAAGNIAHQAAFLCAFAVFLAIGVSVQAQTGTSACPATSPVAINDHGLERIKVTSPCRKNEPFWVSYGSWQQQAAFSDEGVASVAVALATDNPSPIILSYRDGAEDKVAVDFSPLSSVLRITLQWDAPVDLNLHVVEPGGFPGKKGDASAGHSPALFGLMGRLDLEDDGSGLSPFQESYVLPNRLERPSDVFSVYVENVTRGKTPAGEYCGPGQYAKIGVNIIAVDRGKVKRRHIELPVARCDIALEDREYFLRLPI